MAQVSIRFVATGTRSYTVGNDVVGGVMKMEAIGAGGAGGTSGATFGGGGGKGGAYARRNAQSVLAGQSLTITVPPAATTTAGAVASVSIAGGQISYSSPARTSTATNGGTATQSEAMCYVLPQKTGQTISYVGGVLYQTSSAGAFLPYPAEVQVGDLILFISGLTAVNRNNNWIPSGFVKFVGLGDADFSQPNRTGEPVGYYKIADSNDVGGGFDAPEQSTAGSDVYAFIAYRGCEIPILPSNHGSGTSVSMGGKSNSIVSWTCYSYVLKGNGAPDVASQPTTPAGTTSRIVGGTASLTSAFMMHSDEPMAQQSSTATTLLSARGGAVGANGQATAGGAGATAQNGTFVGDVEFLGGNGTNGGLTTGGVGGGGAGDASSTTGAGPNTQFGVSRGQGGASATAGTAFGGGGGGASTLGARGAGAQGIVVLTYSTGVGTISHTARFNRKLTLFRRGIAAITNLAVFDRKVTLRRMAVATITHVSRALKTLRLRKTSSVTHVAAYTRKALRLRKTASITHVALIRRALRVLRTANITHLAVFRRLVTLRRRFVASITLRARMLVKLEARLIPREGGGGTVINVFRNLFLFDD
jgi:hypothetical protein